MNRTRPTVLIVLAVGGAVVAFLLQAALAAGSFAKLRPEYTLAATLVLIAAGVVTLAIPVRRATRGTDARPVDPFYATRVAVLAKASSLAGAAIGGFGLGLVVEVLIRSGAPGIDAYLRVFSTLGGGVALLVAGLVAEAFCTVRRRGDDDDPGDPPEPEHVHGG